MNAREANRRFYIGTVYKSIDKAEAIELEGIIDAALDRLDAIEKRAHEFDNTHARGTAHYILNGEGEGK